MDTSAIPHPPSDTIFLDRILKRSAQITETDALSLAALWSSELDLIIERMMRITDEAKGPSLHIDARPEAILHAWRPVEAEGYLVIHCLMVSSKHKRKGLGTLLLDSCLRDARKSQCRGVT